MFILLISILLPSFFPQLLPIFLFIYYTYYAIKTSLSDLKTTFVDFVDLGPLITYLTALTTYLLAGFPSSYLVYIVALFIDYIAKRVPIDTIYEDVFYSAVLLFNALVHFSLTLHVHNTLLQVSEWISAALFSFFALSIITSKYGILYKLLHVGDNDFVLLVAYIPLLTILFTKMTTIPSTLLLGVLIMSLSMIIFMSLYIKYKIFKRLERIDKLLAGLTILFLILFFGTLSFSFSLAYLMFLLYVIIYLVFLLYYFLRTHKKEEVVITKLTSNIKDEELFLSKEVWCEGKEFFTDFKSKDEFKVKCQGKDIKIIKKWIFPLFPFINFSMILLICLILWSF
jgi:hypothetical protein